jgi:uncharacterized ferritin-like protein (DUF455 family)
MHRLELKYRADLKFQELDPDNKGFVRFQTMDPVIDYMLKYCRSGDPEMMAKTKEDILARMALVPRTMEARGLDAVPLIRARFLQVKDFEMVKILDIILHDEIGHVEIGNKWFNFLCVSLNIDPIKTYSNLARQYKAPTLRGPFNMEARKKAGFTDDELIELTTKMAANS